MLLLCLFTSLFLHAGDFIPERSLWVWSQEQYLGGSVATDPSEQEKLLQFVERNHFDCIYVESNRLFVSQKRIKALEALVHRSHEKKVKSELLFGSAEWLNQDRMNEVKLWFRQIVFPHLITFKTKPEAIHLDIEPHARDDWRENKKNLLERWLSLIQYISSLAHENGMKITIDIPFFLDDEILTNLNEMVDSVVVMSYRTKFSGGNSISSVTEEERAIFKEKLIIGLETGSSDPLLSFGSNTEKLIEMVNMVEKTFHLNTAVHHYESIRLMK